MAKRYAIYDRDEDEMATLRAYKTSASAAYAADDLDNATVVCLGDVGPDPDPDAEGRPDVQFDCEECGKVDYGLLDGYMIADRKLEGVMFICRLDGYGEWTAEVHPDSAEYFKDFNQEKFLELVVEYCKRNDVWTCPKCCGDVVPDPALAQFEEEE